MASVLERVRAAKAQYAPAAPEEQPSAAAPKTVQPASTVKRLPFHLGGGEYDLATPFPRSQTERSQSELGPPKPDFQRDHNIPFSLGGTNTKRNLGYTPLDRAKKRDALIGQLNRDIKAGKISKQEAIVKANTFYETLDQPGPVRAGLEGVGEFVEGMGKSFVGDLKTVGGGILDRVKKAKEFFAPAPDKVRARDVAREAVDKVYSVAAGFAAPGATYEETHDPKFMARYVSALPEAAVKVAGTALTRPVETGYDILRGTTKGLARTVNTAVINLAGRTREERDMAKEEVDKILNKYLGESDTAFAQGFEMAGAAAPFIAAGGILGEVAGSLTSRIAAAKLGAGASSVGGKAAIATARAAGATGGDIAGFVGTGQLLIDRDASIEERADAVVRDLVAVGLLRVGTALTKKAVAGVKDLIKAKEVTNATARVLAEDAATAMSYGELSKADLSKALTAKAKGLNAQMKKANWPTMSDKDVSAMVSKVLKESEALLKKTEMKGPSIRTDMSKSTLPSTTAPKLPTKASKLAKDYREVAKVAKDQGKYDLAEFLEKDAKIIEGNMGPGAMNRSQVTRPSEGFGGSKPLGFEQTVKKTPGTKPSVRANLQGTYDPITNKATLDRVKQMYRKDPQAVVKLANSNISTADSNMAAQFLIVKHQNAGKYQEAINLIEKVAKQANKQGQAIQALSMYGKLTPDGVARFAQQIIEKANAKLPKGKQITLTPEMVEKFRGQASRIQKLPEGSRERAVATAELVRDLQKPIPPTLGSKIATIQTMAQLLNPKTAIRNLIGNLGFAITENVKDVVAAGVDTAVGAITGKRTKVLPSIGTQLKGAMKGASEGIDDAMKGIDTRGDLTTRFDLPKSSVFKGKFGKKLETALNLELRAPDRAFYQAAFDESLRQQTKAAAKSKGPKPSADQMAEIAHHDALVRTFQDDSVAARILSKTKKALNAGKDFGVGDFVLKYPKTPGSLLSRGIEYSPAGFISTIVEAAKPLFGRAFDQKAFVESFSRATVGTTTLVGTGALLHRVGIITGKSEEPKSVATLKRDSGLAEYRINVSALKRYIVSGFKPETAKLQEGDSLISYDWFQPNAVPLAMGANIDETNAAKNGKVAKLVDAVTNDPNGKLAQAAEKLASLPSTVLESVLSGVDTLAEQPVVQGIQNLFKGGDISKGIIEVLAGVPASFIPTLLNQVRQLADNTQRSTDAPTLGGRMARRAQLRVPLASEGLPERVDIFGKNKEVYQNASNTLFNVFINPAFVTKYQPSDDAKLVLDLYEKTGETGQIPRAVGRTVKVNNQNVVLTAEEQRDLQRLVGKFSAERLDEISKMPAYTKLGDDEKAQKLDSIMSDISIAARMVLLGHKPKKPSKRVKEYVRAMETGDYGVALPLKEE